MAATRIIFFLSLSTLVFLTSAWTIRANFPPSTISTTAFNDTSGWIVKEGSVCINKTSGGWRFFLEGSSKTEFNNTFMAGYDYANPSNATNLQYRNRVALYCPTPASVSPVSSPTSPPISFSVPIPVVVPSPPVATLCVGTSPEPNELFYCDSVTRTYKPRCSTNDCVINSTVSLGSTPITVTQTVQVSGAVTGSTGSQIKIIYDPTSGKTSGLIVSECLSADIPVLIDVPNAPSSSSNSGTILSYASCNSQEATVRFSWENWDECATGLRRRLETTRASSRVNVALIFEPKDPTQCGSSSATGDNSNIIIIGAAVGAAGVLIVAIAIIALAVRPVREKIFPFMKRSHQTQRETLTD